LVEDIAVLVSSAELFSVVAMLASLSCSSRSAN
jgi:hypothetical protein